MGFFDRGIFYDWRLREARAHLDDGRPGEAIAVCEGVLAELTGGCVLVYHDVGPGTGPFTCSPLRFERHLDLFESWGLPLVGLDDALAGPAASGRSAAGARWLHLSVDDAFASAGRLVAPALAARGVPWTLYTAPGLIDHDQAHRHLPWNELAQLATDPAVSIGAHGYAHDRLDRMPAQGVLDDCARCDRRLADELGVVARHFAYPMGHYSRAADAVLRNRYASAATTNSGLNGPSQDPYKLRRTVVLSTWSDADLDQIVRPRARIAQFEGLKQEALVHV